MDEVKFLAEVPLIFCIVNFETTIGGDAKSSAHLQPMSMKHLQFRLNGTQISSQYLS